MQKLISGVLLLIVFALTGCAGGGVPKPYPPLTEPRKTYEFAKQAVAQDDPEAFYYCLSHDTQARFPLSDVKLGWALAGQYFGVFLRAQLENVEQPAPGYDNDPQTAKLDLALGDFQASFLLRHEAPNWVLVFPSRYPMPNLNDLPKEFLKQRPPWRHTCQGLPAHRPYREIPGDWFRRVTIPPSDLESLAAADQRPDWRR